ncbi:MAG: MBL fold metallo-hydrolase, partial [Colwelliaceae bacterium]|nr:MBL fold metallo-hydrolase [Colwelliaceae bacterium]
MKLHQLQGYIQTILLAEYPDRLLLLDGCCRADVTFIKNYITKTLNRPLNHLKLIVVTHMHPDHAGGARKLRGLTGCNIACANVSGEWYSGLDGKLMHITDILLTRWVANKMKKKQRWLWYPTKLNADFKLNDGEILPNF